MNKEQVTMSAVVTIDLKQALERWAREADRTVSAELRLILAREIQRRQQKLQTQN